MKNMCQIGLVCPFCHHTEDGEMACTFPDVDPREGKEYRLVCNIEGGECDLYPTAESPLWNFLRLYRTLDRQPHRERRADDRSQAMPLLRREEHREDRQFQNRMPRLPDRRQAMGMERIGRGHPRGLEQEARGMTRPTVSKMETVPQPLDCPFCGAPASTYAAWDHWGVECTFCDAKIMGYSTREGAINAWNRPRRMPRPDSPMEDPAWSMPIKVCCKEMADAIMMNDIRQGVVRDQDGSLSILWPDGDMMPLRFCPCCGKRVEPATMSLTEAQIRDMERCRICSILKGQGIDCEDKAILLFGMA